jgi:hypothetical protein
MGLNIIFSSDSRDDGGGCGWHCSPEPKEKVVRVNSTPDPTNFEVLERNIVNGYPILLVRYPGVKNYEGRKILMYKKNFDLSLIKNRIDPHFFIKGDSPIARFEPTTYGIVLSETLANNLM